MPIATGMLVDYWWFRDLGFEVLFSRTITTRLMLFAIGAGLTGAVVWANLRFAQRGAVSDVIRMQVHAASGEQVVDLSRVIDRLTRPVTLALAVMFGLGASALWDVTLQASLATPFGVTDPVFGRDVGFYVFTLPAISAVLGVLAIPRGPAAAHPVGDLLPPRRHRAGTAPPPDRAVGGHAPRRYSSPFIFVVWALQLWFVDTSNLLFSTDRPVGGRELHRHARDAAGAAGLSRGRPACSGRGAHRWRASRTRGLRRGGAGRVWPGVGGRPRPHPGTGAEVHRGPHRAHPRGAVSWAATSPPRAWRGESTASRSATWRERPLSASPASATTPQPSTTCGSGTASRCSAPSARSRRFGPITISCRSTTIGTGSMADTGRCCSHHAS